MEGQYKSFAIAIAVLFVAILSQFWQWGFSKKEEIVISAWKNYIRRPHRKFERISIGINSNLDLIVPAIDLFKALNVQAGKKQNHDSLTTLGDLQETFNFFFTKGAAAERFCKNEKLFQRLVETAERLPSKEKFLGGNAALMATRVANLFPKAKIQFVGPVGPEVLQQMPKSVSVPPNSIKKEDEIHLILEYKVGHRWGDMMAHIASRFITSHDESNAKGAMLETFFKNMEEYKPDLVLFSGLHMLEGQTPEFFKERIKMVSENLKTIPFNTPVHLELASMANQDYVKQIIERVIMTISSLGLNEQELMFASQAANGPHPDYFTNMNDDEPEILPKVSSLGLNDHEIKLAAAAGGPAVTSRKGQPEIHKITDMILWLLKNYGHSNERPRSKLTRVHFHSLTFHIVGAQPKAWKNLKSSVAAGTRIAGRQACDTKHLTAEQVDLKIPMTYKLYTGDDERQFDEKNPVTFYQLEGFHFAFSPVLVCKLALKTVGLGDAISSTGIMYSEYNPYFFRTE